jgi:hypothetical protein
MPTRNVDINITQSGNAVTQIQKLTAATKSFISVLAIRKITQFTMSLVDLASAATEIKNKFDVVYKGLSETQKNLKDLRKYTHTATSTLRDLTGELGYFIKSSGLSTQASLTMSKQIVKLAADISSLKDVKLEEVIRAYISGLAGMSRPMRRFSVDITEAALAQEAFNLGLISSLKEYKSLDAWTKRNIRVQAIFSKAIKDSADAVGDLERTQHTYANQSRRLQQNLKELGEEVGEELIPALTEAVKLMNDLLETTEAEDLETQIKNRQEDLHYVQEIARIRKEYQDGEKGLIETGKLITSLLDVRFANIFKIKELTAKLLQNEEQLVENEDMRRLVANYRLVQLDEELKKHKEIAKIVGVRIEEEKKEDVSEPPPPRHHDPTADIEASEKLRREAEKRRLERIRATEQELSDIRQRREEEADWLIKHHKETYDPKDFQKYADIQVRIEEGRAKKMMDIRKDESRKQLEMLRELKERNDNRLAWEQEYEEKRKLIRETSLDATADFYGSLAELIASGKKTHYENALAYQVLASSETMISTYSAAQKVFEATAFAYPFNYVAAAAAVANGLARVSKILETDIPAREFGGGVNAGQPYIVGERGRETFIPDVSGRVVPGSFARNININIRAWDAKSVEDWLHEGGAKKIARALR